MSTIDKFPDWAPKELVQLASSPRCEDEVLNGLLNDPKMKDVWECLRDKVLIRLLTDPRMEDVWKKLREVGMVDSEQDEDGRYRCFVIVGESEKTSRPSLKHPGSLGGDILPSAENPKTPFGLYRWISGLKQSRDEEKLRSKPENYEALKAVKEAANNLNNLIEKYGFDRHHQAVDYSLMSKVVAQKSLPFMVCELPARGQDEAAEEADKATAAGALGPLYEDAINSYKSNNPTYPDSYFPVGVTNYINEYINMLTDPKTEFRLAPTVRFNPGTNTNKKLFRLELIDFMNKVYKDPLCESVEVLTNIALNIEGEALDVNDNIKRTARAHKKKCEEANKEGRS